MLDLNKTLKLKVLPLALRADLGAEVTVRLGYENGADFETLRQDVLVFAPAETLAAMGAAVTAAEAGQPLLDVLAARVYAAVNARLNPPPAPAPEPPAANGTAPA